MVHEPIMLHFRMGSAEAPVSISTEDADEPGPLWGVTETPGEEWQMLGVFLLLKLSADRILLRIVKQAFDDFRFGNSHIPTLRVA
jgi:hypothetical protein